MAKKVVSKPQPKGSSKTEDNSAACAILSYLLVGLIWYLVDANLKKNSFAKFHARQALALLLSWIVVMIIGMFVFWIPVVGWVLAVVVYLFFLILWILGIIYAATGKETSLPFIGGFAEKLSI
jgi:uncharacterized membrane protein